MTAPASADVDRVRAAIAQPSFTPGRRDLGALLALIAGTAAAAPGDAQLAAATRALLRADAEAAVAAAVGAIDRALGSAVDHTPGAAAPDDAAAARLVAAAGQLARKLGGGGAPLAARLLALAGARPAGAPRATRAAYVALGKLGEVCGDAAREALCAAWDRADLPPDHRRAVAEALGKVGGDAARARLDGAAPAVLDADPELRRRRDRAILMSERDATRDAASRVRGDVATPADVTIVLRCRTGLEGVLADELGARAARVTPGAVRVPGGAPLGALFAARTWLTAGIERALPPGPADTLPARIAAALAAPDTRALLAALTDGPIRWRLQLAGAGHQRAVVWRTAQAVRAAAPELLNDPTRTTWDVVVELETRRASAPAAVGALELRPRRLDDPRFAYRVADVPAASHPTIAAALARLAEVRPDDVVWDPFCGSGAELIERARLGPCARLVATDLDDRALDAARANLAAAGLTDRATVARADALVHAPPGVTLIITNPPLGRRVRGDAPALLEQFAAHAARVLVPGGRLVWITPVPRRTERAARHAGLRRTSTRTVDLGGYPADLERWERPRG